MALVTASGDASEEAKKPESENQETPVDNEVTRELRREERRIRREERAKSEEPEVEDLAKESRADREERRRSEREASRRNDEQKKTKEKDVMSKASFSGFGTAGIGLFRNAGVGGRATQFMSTFNKFMKENANDVGITAFNESNKMVLLRDFHTALVSVIALVSTTSEKMYYNLIVVENKESIVQDRTKKADRRDRRRGRASDDVRVYQALPDMLDDKVLGRIHDYLLSALGDAVRSDDLLCTGYTKVGYRLELDNFDLIKPIIAAAFESNVEASGEIDELDEQYFKDKGIQMEAVIGINGGQVATGFGGQPIRNDISISLETFANQDNRNPLDNDRDCQQWATGSAYVDLIPGMSRYNDDGEDRRERRTSLHACFTPRIIFTEIDTYQHVVESPLVRAVMVLSTAASLSDRCRYYRALLPRFDRQSNGVDVSIANLGYLMDPSGEVKPNVLEIDERKSDEEVQKILDKLIRHDLGIEIAFRFVEGQPGSSIMNVFQDIYEGVDGAEDHLYDVMDLATGGQFTKEMDRLRCDDIVVDVIEMPDGYITGNSLQPITDIDSLYVGSALRDTNWNRLDEYVECTSTNSPYDYDERMTKLVDQYNYLTQDKFKYTDNAQVFIFNPLFIEAAFAAFSKSKAALRVDRDRDEFRGRRGERTSSTYGLRSSSDRGGRNRDSGRRSRERSRYNGW